MVGRKPALPASVIIDTALKFKDKIISFLYEALVYDSEK